MSAALFTPLWCLSLYYAGWTAFAFQAFVCFRFHVSRFSEAWSAFAPHSLYCPCHFRPSAGVTSHALSAIPDWMSHTSPSFVRDWSWGVTHPIGRVDPWARCGVGGVLSPYPDAVMCEVTPSIVHPDWVTHIEAWLWAYFRAISIG